MSNGVDIVKTDRFINAKDNLLNSIFTEKELEYIKSKGNSVDTIAGLYAAKEAVLKSLGISLNVYPVKDIEIDHENGVPFVVLHNQIKKDKSKCHFSLSISHDGGYAIAFVISY